MTHLLIPGTRAAVVVVVACVSALLAVASPAQAAPQGWQPTVSAKGGVAQACRVPRATTVNVRLRANNLKGKSALTAGMQHIRGELVYTQTARPRQISNTIVLTFNRGALVRVVTATGVGTTDEVLLRVGDLRRCAGARPLA